MIGMTFGRYTPTLATVFFLLPKTSHLGTLLSNRSWSIYGEMKVFIEGSYRIWNSCLAIKKLLFGQSKNVRELSSLIFLVKVWFVS